MLKTAIHTDGSISEQSSSLIKQVGIVICASAVIAVCARLSLPLPFTPVPLTLGNFAVLLVGLAIGSRRGFAAAALYLGWGAMGLPVFSSAGPGGIAQMLGPTGGYLWAYPVMAFLAGWIAERGHPSLARNLVAGTIGELALFAGGLGLAGDHDAQLATRGVLRVVSVLLRRSRKDHAGRCHRGASASSWMVIATNCNSGQTF